MRTSEEEGEDSEREEARLRLYFSIVFLFSPFFVFSHSFPFVRRPWGGRDMEPCYDQLLILFIPVISVLDGRRTFVRAIPQLPWPFEPHIAR